MFLFLPLFNKKPVETIHLYFYSSCSISCLTRNLLLRIINIYLTCPFIIKHTQPALPMLYFLLFFFAFFFLFLLLIHTICLLCFVLISLVLLRPPPTHLVNVHAWWHAHATNYECLIVVLLFIVSLPYYHLNIVACSHMYATYIYIYINV